MGFQSYAVWPHMTVFDNVAYGLRVRKQGAADIKANVDRVLDLVQMRHLAERAVSKLLGGQQQRVAPARAIAFSPTVVLFDEPLSNLDAKLRAEMRDLQRRLAITSVYVTRDQEEALAHLRSGDVMIVGVIEQIGTPEAIYNRPRSRFVAHFVGSANLIEGKVTGHAVVLARALHPARGVDAPLFPPPSSGERARRAPRRSEKPALVGGNARLAARQRKSLFLVGHRALVGVPSTL